MRCWGLVVGLHEVLGFTGWPGAQGALEGKPGKADHCPSGTRETRVTGPSPRFIQFPILYALPSHPPARTHTYSLTLSLSLSLSPAHDPPHTHIHTLTPTPAELRCAPFFHEYYKMRVRVGDKPLRPFTGLHLIVPGIEFFSAYRSGLSGQYTALFDRTLGDRLHHLYNRHIKRYLRRHKGLWAWFKTMGWRK